MNILPYKQQVNKIQMKKKMSYNLIDVILKGHFVIHSLTFQYLLILGLSEANICY